MNLSVENSPIDFIIACGYRNQEDQDKAYAQGYSKVKYPNGKHNKNPSLAVDIAPYVNGAVIWDDITLFHKLADHIKGVAYALDIDVEWGGDWKEFVDFPHWQIKEK
jgi:peptidoglycan L-alanyl-D-glutamate endopeptidase CwlK